MIEGDLVIVGVGIEPVVAPLMCAGATAGLTGVAVDSSCRTSLPNVFAIGDCAEHPNAFFDGGRLRLESIQNANDQAMVVARSIMGVVTTTTPCRGSGRTSTISGCRRPASHSGTINACCAALRRHAPFPSSICAPGE
ncbi:MAG: FAD-dependent oxidoreductase [Hyphomicrobium sp.]